MLERGMRAITLITAISSTLCSAEALARPSYTLDRTKSDVVRLSGLGDEQGACARTRFSGRVAQRRFDPAIGTKLTGITIESRDGTRDFINVEIPAGTEAFDQRWIAQGLQKLTTEGRRVTVAVLGCGAAGRVMYLDGIQ